MVLCAGGGGCGRGRVVYLFVGRFERCSRARRVGLRSRVGKLHSSGLGRLPSCWLVHLHRLSREYHSTYSARYIERGICARSAFDDLYASVEYSGLPVQAICWAINATHQDRMDLEAESRAYYQNWTNFDYQGFTGFVQDPDSPRGVAVVPSPPANYYYSVHYCAPYTGFNLNALDFDIRTSPPRRAAVEKSLETKKPALTDRVVLLGDVAEIDGYSVILMHPGIQAPNNAYPNEVALVVVRIRSLLLKAARTQARDATIVMYYTTYQQEDPHFMGGVDIAYLSFSPRQLLYWPV